MTTKLHGSRPNQNSTKRVLRHCEALWRSNPWLLTYYAAAAILLIAPAAGAAESGRVLTGPLPPGPVMPGPLSPGADLLGGILPGPAAPAPTRTLSVQSDPTRVQPTQRGVIRSRTITVETDNAQMIALPEPARTVSVASPDVADIQVANPTSVLVFGKKVGTTNVFAISESGVTTSYSIRVVRPTGELVGALRREVPSAQLTVSATAQGATISGHVGSPLEAAKVKAIAMDYLGDKASLNFNLTVDGGTQVTLRVRVAEMSRSVDRRLGVNWGTLLSRGTLGVGLLTGTAPLDAAGAFVRGDTATTFGSVGLNYNTNNGKTNVAALIDALDSEGLATILAEPSLTATSGETANFLAGGEFPIPVPQGNQTVTVDYKRYGVSVDFTPTVLDGNRISVKVRPEVSQLTSVGGLSLNGVQVPALTVRRAETTVEMASGDSFAIAGLFQNNGTNQVQALPGLGDLPILGALFRSTSFQRNESELVIIVTPFIVRPVTQASDLHLPTEGFHFSGELERILTGRTTSSQLQRASAGPASRPVPTLRGSSGFMLE